MGYSTMPVSSATSTNSTISSFLSTYIESVSYGPLNIPEASGAYGANWSTANSSTLIEEIEYPTATDDEEAFSIPNIFANSKDNLTTSSTVVQYYVAGASDSWFFGYKLVLKSSYQLTAASSSCYLFSYGRTSYSALTAKVWALDTLYYNHSYGCVGVVFLNSSDNTIYLLTMCGASTNYNSNAGLNTTYYSNFVNIVTAVASEGKTVTLYTSTLGNAEVSVSGSITMTEDVTVTVTPIDGYLLSECGIWDSDGENGTYIFDGTVSSDGTTGTITIPYDSVEDGLALYVWTETYTSSKTYTLECNTDNVSLSTNGGTVSRDVIVTVTANSGYEFEDTATGWLGPSDSDVWVTAEYIDSDTLQFTIPYSYLYSSGTTTLYCEVSDPVAVTYGIALYSYDGSSGYLPYTVESTGSESFTGSVAIFVNGVQLSTSQLSNISSSTQLIIDGYTSVDSLEYIFRTTQQLTTVPAITVLDSSYNEIEFNAIESISGSYYLYTITVPTDYATYYSTSRRYGWITYVSQDAEYDSDANKITITITTSSENAELSITSASTTSSDIIFNVIPNNGYYFGDDDACVATWNDYYVYGYTNSNGYMVLTLPYSQLADGDVITVTWTVSETTSDDDDDNTTSSDDYNMFTVYRPTTENMSTIKNSVFIDSDGTYSILSYFIKYSKFYVTIPIAGTTELKANGVSFGVDAPYVDSFRLTYDLGSIEVAETLNNAFDYKPYVECKIYLPMIGLESIDTSDIMNKTVQLKYTVDVIGGNCLAQLYSEDILVDQWSGKIALDLPLESGGYNDGILDSMSSAMLGDLTPYIKIIRHSVDADDLSEYEGYSSNSIKVVGDCEGYVKFEEIWIDGTLATQQERESIKQLLTSGVIV